MAGEVWFCVQCEDANVTSSDADRCCLMCGIDLVSDQQLREVLQRAGLHIVTEAERQQMVQSKLDAVVTRAERKVLEAWGSAKPEWLRDMRKTISGPAEWVAWMKDTLDAELARRGGTRG